MLNGQENSQKRAIKFYFVSNHLYGEEVFMKNKIAEYRKWLEAVRSGLPPMPKDYIDSQIEAVELYVKWLLEKK